MLLVCRKATCIAVWVHSPLTYSNQAASCGQCYDRHFLSALFPFKACLLKSQQLPKAKGGFMIDDILYVDRYCPPAPGTWLPCLIRTRVLITGFRHRRCGCSGKPSTLDVNRWGISEERSHHKKWRLWRRPMPGWLLGCFGGWELLSPDFACMITRGELWSRGHSMVLSMLVLQAHLVYSYTLGLSLIDQLC